jgi:large subunit ribosomal protein L18
VIDDTTGNTIAAASSLEKSLSEQRDLKGKISVASIVGERVAERAIDKGVKRIVFDRNGFLYHGRIKALSEGARKAGLDF